MARVGGRSIAMSWIVGLLCAAVVVALLWLSMPMLPVLIEFTGDALRRALP